MYGVFFFYDTILRMEMIRGWRTGFLMKRGARHFTLHCVGQGDMILAGNPRWESPVAQPTWQMHFSLSKGQEMG